MRTITTTIYTYNELSDKTKERAREWYREGGLEYNWWDFLYEDFDQRASELGIELSRKSIPLMNGKTRSEPEIYFSGFYHQGSGSSFTGRWRAGDMQVDKLKSECPTDTELHRIADVLADCAKEDKEMWADIGARRDNWISIDVCDGDAIEDKLNELEYKSNEYNLLAQACKQREDEIIEALRDFNRWIYRSLEREWEWINSDEQVAESIIANEYEFTKDGKRA